eukprot:1219814-Pleurochrysis_carterae.AAC.1
MQYLVNLHPSRKPGTSSAVWYSAEAVMMKCQLLIQNFLRIEIRYLQRTQSARDRQPRTRAPEGAGNRRAGRARVHTRSAIIYRDSTLRSKHYYGDNAISG